MQFRISITVKEKIINPFTIYKYIIEKVKILNFQ